MKSVIYKFSIVLCTIACLLGANSMFASAREVNGVIQIPKAVISYAEQNKQDVFQMLEESGELSETEDSDLWLADPYVIYNSSAEQEAIYYFPVVQGDSIVSLFTVLDTENGLIYQCGEDMAEYLNQVDYLGTKPVIYEYNDCLYVESEASKTCLFTFSSDGKAYSEAEVQNAEEFFDLTYSDKCHKINQKILDMVPCKERTASSDSNLDELMKGSLTLHKPMGQYGYGMCWASAVATVVNFKKTSAVTPFEVCNRMGIGYNAGGSIYNEQSALSLYGVSYNNIRRSMLDWATIKDNIDNNHPIIANLICNDGSLSAHAVTIYGYTSSKTLKYWDSRINSGNGNNASTSFSSAGNNFLAISGHSFSWGTTLSKK